MSLPFGWPGGPKRQVVWHDAHTTPGRHLRILIVKLSSLGDVVHAMPVVHDIQAAFPGAQVDWVVEPGFAPLVRRVQGVGEVIECAQRRWRKAWWSSAVRAEWRGFRQRLAAQRYDAVLDLQGLTKSALIARLARGTSFGLANRTEGSSFERPARWLVDRPIAMRQVMPWPCRMPARRSWHVHNALPPASVHTPVSGPPCHSTRWPTAWVPRRVSSASTAASATWPWRWTCRTCSSTTFLPHGAPARRWRTGIGTKCRSSARPPPRSISSGPHGRSFAWPRRHEAGHDLAQAPQRGSASLFGLADAVEAGLCDAPVVARPGRALVPPRDRRTAR